LDFGSNGQIGASATQVVAKEQGLEIALAANLKIVRDSTMRFKSAKANYVLKTQVT
jgi:hypothetical protein